MQATSQPRVARASRSDDAAESRDQRVHLHGVSWKAYEALLAMRGESSAVRIWYLKGVVELMAPSWNHEADKTRLARLVEAWSEEVGIDLEGAGSWTLKNEEAERGAEPDECYVIVSRHKTLPPPIPVPDFAIEVVRSSGGIDKLEIYRLLGVRELWVLKDGELRFHLLRNKQYVGAKKSALLPSFDPALVLRFMSGGTQPEAVRALRKALARTSRRR